MIYTIVHDFLEVSINNKWASQVAPVVKNLSANAGDTRDMGLVPESGRSLGVGDGNSFQYSRLGNPMDRRVCWSTVHEVTELDSTYQLTNNQQIIN